MDLPGLSLYENLIIKHKQFSRLKKGDLAS
jgi:hypothetical protein